MRLDAAYVERAKAGVALQLSRAEQLAAVLNRALGKQVAGEPRMR
jgi:hypothetical protein